MTTTILVAQKSVSKAYYENGKIKNETPYINGKIEGANTAYYENGKVSNYVMYESGKKKGKWFFILRMEMWSRLELIKMMCWREYLKRIISPGN